MSTGVFGGDRGGLVRNLTSNLMSIFPWELLIENGMFYLNQRRNGKALSSLTARGGGLPIEVNVRGQAMRPAPPKVATP
jgi:hypothetical protein